MLEPSLKCENNSIFNQNYTQKLFIAFKMAHSCFFGLRGIKITHISSKKFYNNNF